MRRRQPARPRATRRFVAQLGKGDVLETTPHLGAHNLFQDATAPAPQVSAKGAKVCSAISDWRLIVNRLTASPKIRIAGLEGSARACRLGQGRQEGLLCEFRQATFRISHHCRTHPLRKARSRATRSRLRLKSRPRPLHSPRRTRRIRKFACPNFDRRHLVNLTTTQR